MTMYEDRYMYMPYDNCHVVNFMTPMEEHSITTHLPLCLHHHVAQLLGQGIKERSLAWHFHPAFPHYIVPESEQRHPSTQRVKHLQTILHQRK